MTKKICKRPENPECWSSEIIQEKEYDSTDNAFVTVYRINVDIPLGDDVSKIVESWMRKELSYTSLKDIKNALGTTVIENEINQKQQWIEMIVKEALDESKMLEEWKEYLGMKKFKVWDYSGQASARELEKFIESPLDYESSLDYFDDEYNIFKEVFEEWLDDEYKGVEINDIVDVDSFRFHMEENNIDVNWSDAFNNNYLLKYYIDDDEIIDEIIDDVIDDVKKNAGGSGSWYMGYIVNGKSFIEQVFEACNLAYNTKEMSCGKVADLKKILISPEGDTIVGIHDAFSGGGYFVETTFKKDMKIPIADLVVDIGKYSVGGIGGNITWNFRP